MNRDILVVAGVSVKQDEQGRFCLNDLHRAAGGEKRHQPSDWLRVKQTLELVEELSTPGIPGVEQNQPVNVINGGDARGTYVAKELVYAYAMWISPSFMLQVIRKYDEAVTLELSLLQGKAETLSLISASPESYCITDAAKILSVPPRKLFATLQSKRWIYRRNANRPWVAYQKKIANGFMESKLSWDKAVSGQVRVTTKGLVVLSSILK